MKTQNNIQIKVDAQSDFGKKSDQPKSNKYIQIAPVDISILLKNILLFSVYGDAVIALLLLLWLLYEIGHVNGCFWMDKCGVILIEVLLLLLL